ncbi:hypothetical protein D3C87_1827200 [compost metagenome]
MHEAAVPVVRQAQLKADPVGIAVQAGALGDMTAHQAVSHRCVLADGFGQGLGNHEVIDPEIMRCHVCTIESRSLGQSGPRGCRQ